MLAGMAAISPTTITIDRILEIFFMLRSSSLSSCFGTLILSSLGTSYGTMVKAVGQTCGSGVKVLANSPSAISRVWFPCGMSHGRFT